MTALIYMGFKGHSKKNAVSNAVTNIKRSGKMENLNKKVYLCEKCLQHQVLNENESMTKCPFCGHEKLVLGKFPDGFIPRTLGQLKKMDAMEISADEINKYTKDINNEFMDKYFHWFMNDGVVRILMGKDIIDYVEFHAIDDKNIKLSVYEFYKFKNGFIFLYNTEITLDDEHNVIADLISTSETFQKRLDDDERIFNMVYTNLQTLVNSFVKAHGVFNYLADNRKVEEIKCINDRSIKKTEISKRGTVKVKTKHIIYMTDTIKIYTYDGSMANKIRHHEPISIPFWKVREHTRRVFAKEDRGLPKDERRVVKTNIIKPFLKGKERFNHSLSECEGTLYKIAR